MINSVSSDHAEDEEYVDVGLGTGTETSEMDSIRSAPMGGSKNFPLWVFIMRYVFQCSISLMFMAFCMMCVGYDIFKNGEPTYISTMAFPSIATTMGLHFTLKGYPKSLKSKMKKKKK